MNAFFVKDASFEKCGAKQLRGRLQNYTGLRLAGSTNRCEGTRRGFPPISSSKSRIRKLEL
jgi:hypothetical protein